MNKEKKGPLKEGLGLFAFCLWLLVWRALGAWAFGGFDFILLLWAFWCGMLLEWKRITEGRRITGKLLKGKE
jgi:hypothetical protein